MSTKHQASAGWTRREWIGRLLPEGMPHLWCPLLTHYLPDGGLDRQRMVAHLRNLAPYVKGFLVPGSTGDAWEMTETEIDTLLDIVLEEADRLRLHVLIGVLQADARSAAQAIRQRMDKLEERTGEEEVANVLVRSRVCGFTVCPPKGKDLSQQDIGAGLETVLAIGVPIALYQLPQVTQNEMEPALVSSLATRFENLLLLKDTSGTDRVATSGPQPEGVFLVRGAEGDYARWLKAAGGPYDGLLLSTANCFAPLLRRMMDQLANGKAAAGREISVRLTGAAREIFRVVAGLPDGNPFANANKAMDHFFAHGPGAAKAPAPRLHAGSHLPADVIRAAGEVLIRHELMPIKGYLE